MQEHDKVELSAFFDDEAADTGRVAELLKTQQGRDAWARKCAIRDAIRGDALTGLHANTVDRVSTALADEPVVLNPSAGKVERVVGAPVPRSRQMAGLALAATVAGVAFLGLTQFNAGAPSDQLASGERPAAVTEFPPTNGLAGAVVADDVRPVTRLVTEPELSEEEIASEPTPTEKP